MNDTQVVADFCRILARVRSQFREAHIAVENSGRFAGVSCTVSHAEKDLIDGDKRVDAVEVSFSLDCDLREVTSDGKYSLGGSVAIYIVENAWKCYGDVGWSHRETGWEDFASMEAEFASFQDLLIGLPEFTERVLCSYNDLTNEHFEVYS